MENFVTNAIIVQWKGKDKILHSKTELIRFYLECAGLQDAQLCWNNVAIVDVIWIKVRIIA